MGAPIPERSKVATVISDWEVVGVGYGCLGERRRGAGFV
jgi:hypothetical protein